MKSTFKIWTWDVGVQSGEKRSPKSHLLMLKPYSTSNMHSLRSEERPGRKMGDFWLAQWPQGGPSREKKTKKERKRRKTTENLAKKNESKGKKNRKQEQKQ